MSLSADQRYLSMYHEAFGLLQGRFWQDSLHWLPVDEAWSAVRKRWKFNFILCMMFYKHIFDRRLTVLVPQGLGLICPPIMRRSLVGVRIPLR